MVLIEDVSGGTRRRCDTTCYNATGRECSCVCGGTNHGIGLDAALYNTSELVREALKVGGDTSRYSARVLFEAIIPGLYFQWPFTWRKLLASGRAPTRCPRCGLVLNFGSWVTLHDGSYWHVECFESHLIDRPHYFHGRLENTAPGYLDSRKRSSSLRQPGVYGRDGV